MNLSFFFFNDTATTEIYPLSLHDALPIWRRSAATLPLGPPPGAGRAGARCTAGDAEERSEEHTSELQSQSNLVCRLLLEKKKYNECVSTPYHGNLHRRCSICNTSGTAYCS